MYLDSLTFTENIVLDHTRESQSSMFKIKTKKRKIEDKRRPFKRTHPWEEEKFKKKEIEEKTFVLFKKGLSINFKDITVIVGDNGSGKTSLLKKITPPSVEKPLFSILSDEEEEDYVKETYRKWLTRGGRELKFSSSPSFIFIEKDIHKTSFNKRQSDNIQQSTFNGSLKFNEFGSYWSSLDFSNGETTIDFLNSLEQLKGGIIILDEPETSLSIKTQLKVCSALKELAKYNQIIVVTHSEYFMDLVPEVYDLEKKKYISTQKYIVDQKKHAK